MKCAFPVRRGFDSITAAAPNRRIEKYEDVLRGIQEGLFEQLRRRFQRTRLEWPTCPLHGPVLLFPTAFCIEHYTTVSMAYGCGGQEPTPQEKLDDFFGPSLVEKGAASIAQDKFQFVGVPESGASAFVDSLVSPPAFTSPPANIVLQPKFRVGQWARWARNRNNLHDDRLVRVHAQVHAGVVRAQSMHGTFNFSEDELDPASPHPGETWCHLKCDTNKHEVFKWGGSTMTNEQEDVCLLNGCLSPINYGFGA